MQAPGACVNARLGPVRVIPGENHSRFPFCTSIFVDDDVKVLIDPGAGVRRLQELKKTVSIDLVIDTHYHFDHISGNYLFDRAQIIINDRESSCFRNRKAIGSALGMEETYGRAWVDDWLRRIADPKTEQSPYSPQNNHAWWLSTSRVDGEYTWGDVMHFGKTAMHVIGAPGHSGGFSCMYFPDFGAVYTADLDLTEFGPWYGGSDSDIDQFITSGRNIAALDARFFITGHEKGVVGRDEFRSGMERFLNIIERRDRAILSMLEGPATLQELAGSGIIYGKRYHSDAWVYMWELIMIKKHVTRLVKKGLVQEEGGKFAAR